MYFLLLMCLFLAFEYGVLDMTGFSWIIDFLLSTKPYNICNVGRCVRFVEFCDVEKNLNEDIVMKVADTTTSIRSIFKKSSIKNAKLLPPTVAINCCHILLKSYYYVYNRTSVASIRNKNEILLVVRDCSIWTNKNIVSISTYKLIDCMEYDNLVKKMDNDIATDRSLLMNLLRKSGNLNNIEPVESLIITQIYQSAKPFLLNYGDDKWYQRRPFLFRSKHDGTLLEILHSDANWPCHSDLKAIKENLELAYIQQVYRPHLITKKPRLESKFVSTRTLTCVKRYINVSCQTRCKGLTKENLVHWKTSKKKLQTNARPWIVCKESEFCQIQNCQNDKEPESNIHKKSKTVPVEDAYSNDDDQLMRPLVIQDSEGNKGIVLKFSSEKCHEKAHYRVLQNEPASPPDPHFGGQIDLNEDARSRSTKNSEEATSLPESIASKKSPIIPNNVSNPGNLVQIAMDSAIHQGMTSKSPSEKCQKQMGDEATQNGEQVVLSPPHFVRPVRTDRRVFFKLSSKTCDEAPQKSLCSTHLQESNTPEEYNVVPDEVSNSDRTSNTVGGFTDCREITSKPLQEKCQETIREGPNKGSDSVTTMHPEDLTQLMGDKQCVATKFRFKRINKSSSTKQLEPMLAPIPESTEEGRHDLPRGILKNVCAIEEEKTLATKEERWQAPSRMQPDVECSQTTIATACRKVAFADQILTQTMEKPVMRSDLQSISSTAEASSILSGSSTLPPCLSSHPRVPPIDRSIPERSTFVTMNPFNLGGHYSREGKEADMATPQLPQREIQGSLISQLALKEVDYDPNWRSCLPEGLRSHYSRGAASFSQLPPSTSSASNSTSWNQTSSSCSNRLETSSKEKDRSLFNYDVSPPISLPKSLIPPYQVPPTEGRSESPAQKGHGVGEEEEGDSELALLDALSGRNSEPRVSPDTSKTLKRLIYLYCKTNFADSSHKE